MATTEVAEALSECPGVVEATVYGVAVPGADGKAGMAALVVEDGFDLMGLRRRLAERLPAYAQPVFLRLVSSLAVTETFKQKKADLAREGFDPAVVGEPLYVALPGREGYDPLDLDRCEQIVTGRIRL